MKPEELNRLLAKDTAGSFKSDLDVLDERELEVFSILAQGYSGSQIQSQFGIAPPELKQIKQRIQKKLGLKDEIQLLRRVVKELKG
jgi:DNA-binding NarL/FixJ family response regulator